MNKQTGIAIAAALLCGASAWATDKPDPDIVVEAASVPTSIAWDNRVASDDGPMPAVDGLEGPPAVAVERHVPAVVGQASNDIEWLPALTRAELNAIRDKSGRERNGLVYELDVALSTRGEWIEYEDGSHVWFMSVGTETTDWVRLKFAPFNPPAGVEVMLYNAALPQEAYGPFTAGRGFAGEWWAPTVHGQEARIEIFVPAGIDPVGVAEQIHIAQAAQGFHAEADTDRAACRLDVTCDSAWDTEALGVAHIQFVDGGSSFICTGSMLNRIGGDFAPMFLTAAHCINTEASANSIEVYWLFQTDTCDGTPPALNSVPRTDGSTLLAFWNTTDVSLLGLTGDIPGGLWWQGWDANAIPNNEPGTLIHHPAGVRKSISYGVYEGRDDDQCALGDWTYRLDLSDGGQEGGSSGGPGFDSAKRVRTVASCSETDCSPGENTWEGSFPDTWSRLSPFLDAQSDVWVDISWGGVESGTQAQPWDELIEGYFGVLDGGTVHVVAGNYPTFTWEGPRAMTIEAESGTVIIGD